jgi:DNA-binding ferritin-like protein
MKNNKDKKSKKVGGKRHGKTMKNNKSKKMTNNKEKSHIIRIFLEMLNTVKLYHWKTRSYSQHKATDDLYSNLNGHIDTFVEILLGKDESRVKMLEKRIELIDASTTTDFKSHIFKFRDFLTNDINMLFDSTRDTDLLNVRDEILGDINQFLYLLTFNK